MKGKDIIPFLCRFILVTIVFHVELQGCSAGAHAMLVVVDPLFVTWSLGDSPEVPRVHVTSFRDKNTQKNSSFVASFEARAQNI